MSDIKEDIEDENVKFKKKTFLSSFFNKIKRIKHLDKIITVLFIAIILLIYFSTFSFGTSSTNEKESSENINKEANDLLFYQNELEKKIKQTLLSIKDSGEVNVMICFDGGVETVIAYKTEKQTNANGVVVETKAPILVTNNGKSEPIILEKIMPKPVSIVIVASGAKNTNVRLEMLRAVQTMFNSSTCNIEIFTGN